MASNTVNRPFSGKLNRIEEQYGHFRSYKEAPVDIKAYLNNTPGHQYAKHDRWIKAKTPFTDWNGHYLAANSDVLLIGNQSSFDVAQYPGEEGKASMSMIHILAIPRARLFNGVSLGRDTVGIIEEMISLFKSSWDNPEFRRKVVRHQRDAIERRNNNKPDPEAYKEAVEHFLKLEAMIYDLTVDDFTFGLHLWPDNSVPHLHLHILATPGELRQYSTFEHDAKTKDAIEVCDYIKSRLTA
ncbi:hypothetical protein F4776DRAFT_421471 [Hypoxylon sp. NC0597]|nr:hypothetical protein F4776DRAFT_421471 [Hypoxylon sp. NC0597]